MRKPTACILSSYAPYGSTAASVRLTSLAESLRSRCDVTYASLGATPSTSNVHPFRAVTISPASESGSAPLLWRAIQRLRGLSAIMCYAAIMRRFDVVILSSPPFVHTVFAAAILRIRRIRYVVDVRDLYPDSLFHAGVISESSGTAASLRRLEHWLYQCSTMVSVVTQGMVGFVSSRTDPHKVVMVPNGAETDRFADRLTLPIGKTVVVSHGTIGRFQDTGFVIDMAIMAKRMSAEVEFRYYGSGVGAAQLRQRIEQHGLHEYLRVMPRVRHDEVPKCLSHAHFGLSVRRDDPMSRLALPVRVFEQLAVGLPVVVAPLGEASELVEGESAGRGFALDQAETALLWVLRVSKDHEHYTELSRRARGLAVRFDRRAIGYGFTQEIWERVFASRCSRT